jgi:hypothetical protein
MHAQPNTCETGAAWRAVGLAEEPAVGAHLVTPRGYYSHHGVYVGHGRVIHYPGLSSGLRWGPVEEVTLEHFADGRRVEVRARAAAQFDAPEIVRRARSRLGEDRYQLLRNNCEHFCAWCVHGTSHSDQVESVRTCAVEAFCAAREALARIWISGYARSWW